MTKDQSRWRNEYENVDPVGFGYFENIWCLLLYDLIYLFNVTALNLFV